MKKAKANFLYTFLYKHIHAIIFVSDLAKNEFLLSRPKISLEKISVIHNSIYPTTVLSDNADLRKNYNIGSQTVILAYTGRVVKGKGIEVLLESVKKLKNSDFVLFIAGRGDEWYEKQLKEQIKANGLGNKVFFLGFVDTIPSFISQIDIGIVPSIWRESFGLAIIEFMQAGKPVITTNNGAQPEYITHSENGFLIEPNQSEQLSYSIDFLMEHPEKRTEIGENARQTFQEKLNYDVFYEKIMKVFFSD